MSRRTLTLTPDQRAELEFTRDRDSRPYLRECAAALLKVADGHSANAVAGSGLYKARQQRTVSGWITKYQQHGLAGLVHQPRRGWSFSP